MRFIHAIGRIIGPTPVSDVPPVNVFIADLCDKSVEQFKCVEWLRNDCDSKYKNCVWYGTRRVLIKSGNNCVTYFAGDVRFFEGLSTLFAFPRLLRINGLQNGVSADSVGLSRSFR